MDMPPPMCVRTMPTIRLPIINKSLMAHPIQFITYLAMGLYNSVTFQLNAFAGAQRVGMLIRRGVLVSAVIISVSTVIDAFH